jgi:hypothetical protein
MRIATAFAAIAILGVGLVALQPGSSDAQRGGRDGSRTPVAGCGALSIKNQVVKNDNPISFPGGPCGGKITGTITFSGARQPGKATSLASLIIKDVCTSTSRNFEQFELTCSINLTVERNATRVVNASFTIENVRSDPAPALDINLNYAPGPAPPGPGAPIPGGFEPPKPPGQITPPGQPQTQPKSPPASAGSAYICYGDRKDLLFAGCKGSYVYLCNSSSTAKTHKITYLGPDGPGTISLSKTVTAPPNATAGNNAPELGGSVFGVSGMCKESNWVIASPPL